MLFLLASLTLWTLAGRAGAQTSAPAPAPTPAPTAARPQGVGNGQVNLQSAGNPQAPLDPAAAAALASGSPFPGIPPETPPIYLLRSAPLCTDFQPVANGGWSATGPIQFPGPQGPIKMVAGQTVTPGAYLDGMDLGSVLQRDCPRTPSPPASP